MPEQNITDLVNQLTQLYNERADLITKRRGVVDHQGRPIPSRQQEAQKLQVEINNIPAQVKTVLAEWLANEQKMRVENPPFSPGATVETRFDVVVDAFMIGGKKQPKRASVPTGQVYVLSHGFETLDQSGFPEVYMAGEIIQKNPNRDDVQAWATALSESPGSLRLAARQVLAGISISEEDVAKANFVVPIRLSDPIQTLSRSSTQWMSPIGRKGINLALKEQIEHRIGEFFLDRLQLWSAEKRDVLGGVYAAFTQDLEEWGLTVDTERISLIREYPRNIYEIVLEFASAEQAILDGMAADQDSLIQKTGLAPENLTSIQVSAKQKRPAGIGLFLVVKGFDDQRDSILIAWLKEQSATSAANFVQELYSGRHSDQDVKLSEQVLTSAFKNPILGLGEGLDVNLDQSSYYRRLKEEFDLGLKEMAS